MYEENNYPRVTIDTNLVISGTISPNNIPSQIITSWAQGEFNWIQTQETFGELTEVLGREKFKTKYHIDEESRTFLENLSVGAEFVTPVPLDSLQIQSRDPKDDPILACALGGNCDYLITDDKDLLVLNGKPELEKLQILNAADFLNKKV